MADDPKTTGMPPLYPKQKPGETFVVTYEKQSKTTKEWCHGGRDGECIWQKCPQLRDNEPNATGRHCPLDVSDDDEF